MESRRADVTYYIRVRGHHTHHPSIQLLDLILFSLLEPQNSAETDHLRSFRHSDQAVRLLRNNARLFIL